MVIGAIGTAGATGWAAYATKWLNQFAPISWVIASLLGATIFMFLYWLWATARLRVSKARLYGAIPERPFSINPLDASFEKKRIDIFELRDPVTHIVHDKTFTECELIGKGGVATFSGCRFDGWEGSLGVDFIVLRDDQKEFAFNNVTVFTKCTLKRCKYFNMIMMFNREAADILDNVNKNPIPWLTKK